MLAPPPSAPSTNLSLQTAGNPGSGNLTIYGWSTSRKGLVAVCPPAGSTAGAPRCHSERGRRLAQQP
jgi:hypothetical protein